MNTIISMDRVRQIPFSTMDIVMSMRKFICHRCSLAPMVELEVPSDGPLRAHTQRPLERFNIDEDLFRVNNCGIRNPDEGCTQARNSEYHSLGAAL
jgi:hypothetical protein